MFGQSDFRREIKKLRTLARSLSLKGVSKKDFLAALASIEDQAATLRAMVIRHSRACRQGVRRDGKPDMRFSANRPPARRDLRRSQVTGGFA